MNKTTLISLLDKEKLVQTNIFEHSIEDLEAVYSFLKGIKEKDDNDSLSEIVSKAEITPGKPYSEFVIAITSYLESSENIGKFETLIKRAMSSSKWQYSLFFSNIILEINPYDSFASLSKIQSLEKIGGDTEELKNEILRYTMHEDKEVPMLLFLADLQEKEGNTKDSLPTIKRALSRAIKNKSVKDIKSSVDRLLKVADNNELVTLLSMFDSPSGKALGEKFENCFSDVYRALQKTDNQPLLLKAVKLIIFSSPKNTKYKNDLVEVYKKIYKDSSRLEECLALSSLNADYAVDLNKAIQNFEKDISIDKGTFVYHASHGVGRVTSIEGDNIHMDFIKKRGHKMSHEMALSSLTILEKNHIWVLKAFVSKEKLKTRFNEDPRWGLITLLKSGDDTFKIMKKEIVPQILNEAEWQVFFTSAKKIVKNDPYISVSPTENDRYILGDTPVSNEEKLFSAFKHEPDIFIRIKIVRDSIAEGIPLEGEYFLNMLKFFGSQLRENTISLHYLISHIFLSMLANGRQKVKAASAYLRKSDMELFFQLPLQKVPQYYADLEDADLKKYFVNMIGQYSTTWKEVLSEAYTLSPIQQIEKIMAKRGVEDFVPEMMKKAFFIIKQNPTLFTYLFKAYPNAEDWKCADKTPYDLILAQLDVYNTFPQTDKAKAMFVSLFDNRRLFTFIENTNEELVLQNLDKIVSLSQNLDEARKQEVKHLIAEKLEKEGVLPEEDAKKAKVKAFPKDLLCLASSYDKKKAELDHIINVEIPQNAKDIGEARELGDLRENAEFQYAKDKQKLLNSTMNKLDEEIRKAKIVDPKTFDASSVGFGTVVTIRDEVENSTFKYTIYGPWESDPENDIISLFAPAIREIYGSKKGDKVEFTINGEQKVWTIVDIAKAK